MKRTQVSTMYNIGEIGRLATGAIEVVIERN